MATRITRIAPRRAIGSTAADPWVTLLETMSDHTADEGERDVGPREEQGLVRHGGPRHPGPAHSSPYPVSRLAPTHDLVDTARKIAEADQILGTVVHGKLSVIAEQIRTLQAQARRLLAEAQHDAVLHRARCSFQKRVGHTYHLYTRPDGSSWFSMLGPLDWRGNPSHAFVGSYRLEPDMSWTPLDAAGSLAARPTLAELRALTGIDGG